MLTENAPGSTGLEAEARELAGLLWEQAGPASDSHAFLVRHGIKAYGLKVLDGEQSIGGVDLSGSLLLKIRDPVGMICSIGFITPEGRMFQLPGGRKSGCFFAIDGRKDVIVIARRFTVAASCHEATGYAAAVAFGPGNAIEVAKALRAKYPLARIVIAADVGFDSNDGVEAAQAAAIAVGGFVAVPHPARDLNALALERGLDAVRSAIENAVPPEQREVAGEGGFAAAESEAATVLDPPPAESQQSLLRESLHTAAPVLATTAHPILDPDSPAERLYTWLLRKGLVEFTQRQVLQLGPSALRRAEVARAALQTLVEQGFLVAVDQNRYRVAAIPEAADGTAEADRSPATAK
jgi:phage/plasmid primase-like uncharacterized protein